MIDLSGWMQRYLQALNETFGEKIWCVGLQGSYGRGEATENSDLDLVVILDSLCVSDIQKYDAMLHTLPHRELVCGFMSGKEEIMSWDPADLFQFYYDTNPIQGSLDELLSRIDEQAIRHAIHMGVCNLYHGCVHNMLYEKSKDVLKGLYKSASFVVQAIHFWQTGKYVRQLKDLVESAQKEESVIAETFLALKQGGKVEFQQMSEVLFAWTKKWIAQIGA